MEGLEQAAQLLPVQQRKVRDEDAVQEGFLRMAGRAAGVENPGAYWYTAARRAIVEQQRRSRTERRAVAGWLDHQAARSDGGDGCDPSELQRLAEAVSALRGRRRRLAELELSGVTRIADLAEALETTPGAVKVLRHRTYRQLRQRLAA